MNGTYIEKNIEGMIEEINDNTEWLESSEEDLIECISIENLSGILSKFFNIQIKKNFNIYI